MKLDFEKEMIIMAKGLLLLVVKVFFSIAETAERGKKNMDNFRLGLIWDELKSDAKVFNGEKNVEKQD